MEIVIAGSAIRATVLEPTVESSIDELRVLDRRSSPILRSDGAIVFIVEDAERILQWIDITEMFATRELA